MRIFQAFASVLHLPVAAACASLALGASLLASPAQALEPAITGGINGGVVVFDSLDLPNTSWYATPRLGFWFNHNMGIELDVGISTGSTQVRDHGFMAIAPQLWIVGNPIPSSTQAPVQPILSIGAGSMIKMVDGAGVRGADYAHTRVEGLGGVGTGVIVPIVGPLRFRTDVRMMVTAAREDDRYISPFITFMAMGGLEVRGSLAKDSDRDGIPDSRDACPNDPEDFDGFEDADGCPDPDNDGDGILDADDLCPDDPEDFDGFEDADGCPDPDNDGDGIPDEMDACPNEPGLASADGCPDADGDRIPDGEDRCPNEPGEARFDGCPDSDGDGVPDIDDECPDVPGPPSAFGCPDADGDGVPDYRDDCPNEPAQAGIDPLHSHGCPERVYVDQTNHIVIEEQVFFDTGRATIQRRSFGLLNDIVKVMDEYDDIELVRVEGHTDSTGDAEKNVQLSQDRANAVRDYLIGKGIEGARLIAKGYGPNRPIDSNDTPTGRANNRRVEFTILQMGGKPTEAAAE